MAGPKPPNPPPYPNLQMALTLHRDLEVTIDWFGAMEVERMTLSSPTLLGNGEPASSLGEGGLKMKNGILGGWKNALVGSQVVSFSMEDSKISHNANRPVISLPDTLVDNVTFDLKLCVVGRFIAFRPMIEMACKWVSQKWKIKGSVSISTIPSGLFGFKFTVEEDINFILLELGIMENIVWL